MQQQLDWLRKNDGELVNQLAQLVAIPSISTDGEHQQEIQKVAELTCEQMRWAGLQNVGPGCVDEGEAHQLYETFAVPAPGAPLFQAATANLNPFAATRVNFRNGGRAPLLLIAGGDDHTVPTSVVRSTYKKYARSTATTAFREFPARSHLLIAQDGWEEVAEYALAWATAEVTDATRGRIADGVLV